MTLGWRGPEVAAELHRRAAAAAVAGANRLLEASNQAVPDDPANPGGTDLKRSGKVTSDGNVAAVSYDEPYAVIQHENMHYHHKPGQHAKFLEGAMASERAAIAAIVAREMQV